VDGEDTDDAGGEKEPDDDEDGTEPITMGIQTEGGRDEMNDVDWAAAVFAASVDVADVLSG
jgi:hypothetical protein